MISGFENSCNTSSSRHSKPIRPCLECPGLPRRPPYALEADATSSILLSEPEQLRTSQRSSLTRQLFSGVNPMKEI